MSRTDWAVPEIDHPDVDMYRRQRRAVLYDERPLPCAGLPRDWVDQAIAVVVMFDPDQVFLFGSTLRGEDEVGSDIDLLVAFDGMPLDVWDQWERRIRYTARFFCPYRVNAFVTDVEDLTRRRHIVTSPCMWAQQDGRLVYKRAAPVAATR